MMKCSLLKAQDNELVINMLELVQALFGFNTWQVQALQPNQ